MDGNAKTSVILRGKVVDIPSVDGTLTKSGYAADAKTVGDKLNELRGDMLDGDDVVNNLESEDERKPLSAAMGKVLSDRIGQSGGGGSVYAGGIIYDNSESNLDAHDVQYAITLLASMIRGCLSLDGGTLNGENIYMDGGNVRIQGNENAIWIQALNAALDNENRRLIALYNSAYKKSLKDAISFEDIQYGIKQAYALYGEHNKQHGYYWGTGASNNVNTNSIGHVVFILGTDGTIPYEAALVTAMGGVRIQPQGISFVGSSAATFQNGSLTLNGTPLNAKDTAYEYCVL